MKKQLLCAFFLLFPSLSFAASFTGRVVGISDGDTISVMRDGRAAKIDLADVDCPESRQAFGARARRYTSDLAFGRIVTVNMIDTDPFGVTIGEVILPSGRSLGRELVKAGFAWRHKEHSKDQKLERLEEEARLEKKGLWKEPGPVPPWEFRKKQSGEK